MKLMNPNTDQRAQLLVDQVCVSFVHMGTCLAAFEMGIPATLGSRCCLLHALRPVQVPFSQL